MMRIFSVIIMFILTVGSTAFAVNVEDSRPETWFHIIGGNASKAAAASIAVAEGVAVQDVPYWKLRDDLLAAGQVLSVR